MGRPTAPCVRQLAPHRATRCEQYHTRSGLFKPSPRAIGLAIALETVMRHQPDGSMTTPLSLGQRRRQAKAMSLTSLGLTSNAHCSTPRLSRRLVVVGGVVDGSISTTISSLSETGN